MPRHQRVPHARPQRRPRARYALIGVAVAVVALLAVPAAAPRGMVLDAGDDAGLSGRVPEPPSTPAPAAVAVATGSPPPATPRLLARPAGEPRDLGVDAPPTRRIPQVIAGRPPAWSLEGYRWPLAHPRLTLPFGPTPWGSRWVNGQSFHDGVDLATFCGDRVLAAHDGVVLAAGRRYDRAMGWVGDLRPYLERLRTRHLWSQLPIVVVVDDGNRYRSIYAHMSRITVEVGDVLEAGDLIGYEGMTGRASGCHLHYGLFSPYEATTFRIRPDVVKRMKVPKEQIARVDPLQVLPPRAGINAPRKDRSTAPTPSPTPSPATP